MMKRLFFLSELLIFVLISGTAFADDIPGTYVNGNGEITIKKATAHLVRATFKNGHTSEYVTDKRNKDWVDFTTIKMADNAYFVKIKSAKGDCDYAGLTILQGNDLTVDDDMTYPIFNIYLGDDGIIPNIPEVAGGWACLYMSAEPFKKK